MTCTIRQRGGWIGNEQGVSQGPYETVGEALEQMNLLKWAEVQS